MERFEFAIIAQENTDHWNLPDDSTLKDCRVYSLGMFRVGEATYLCSITPSTYVDEIKNVFVNRDGSPLTDAQMNEIENGYLEYESLDGTYIKYVRPYSIESNPLIGDTYWNEYDPTDYAEGEEGEEEMRRAAWEDAREEMQANCGSYDPI